MSIFHKMCVKENPNGINSTEGHFADFTLILFEPSLSLLHVHVTLCI